MLDAADQVALVQVVRANPHPDQAPAKLLDDLRVVVDAAQQHRLVAQRDAGVGQLAAGLGRFRRDLVGVVEVRVDPERVIFAKHRRQLVGDPHRQHHRHAGPDADDLAPSGPAAGADRIISSCSVGHRQRVAAGDDHVVDFRVLAAGTSTTCVSRRAEMLLSRVPATRLRVQWRQYIEHIVVAINSARSG